MGQPAPAPAGPRTADRAGIHPDVGTDPHPRKPPASCSPPGLPRRNCATCSHWPAPSRRARRSATACSRSMTGAPAPTSPRSPPWPAPSRPGGRRSWPSSIPASPTPPPKRQTGWSRTPPGSPSDSATSTISGAGYGCTANGRSSVSRCEGDQPPQLRRADFAWPRRCDFQHRIMPVRSPHTQPQASLEVKP